MAMSASGTKRTNSMGRFMSATDPKRTSPASLRHHPTAPFALTTSTPMPYCPSARRLHEDCGDWRQRLIGTKTVERLRKKGHEVVAASPKSGVNTVTGEGLAEALAGAQVAIDLANSPSFEDKAVLEFFEASGRNLLVAEKAAGVRHHVALSVVGTGRSGLLGRDREIRQVLFGQAG
jgi:hypothetical protein